jgi:HD-GYP domain-containing protein (c-di-GMP phosphodiesterase class II)
LLKRVKADQVQLGMYVRKFEGSWFRHPFWWARFTVRTEQALARIRESEVDLWIDSDKGLDLPVKADPALAPRPSSQTARPAAPAPFPDRALRSRWADPTPVHAPTRSAPVKTPVAPTAFGKADKVRAQALAQRSTQVVKALFEDGLTAGTAPAGKILSVVDEIASTLEQNSSAFISVTRLKSKNDGLYTHSVAVCALMIGLARELGLPPREVQALGTAGLLHDVGKVRIDDALLRKGDELSDAELVELRQYPQFGFDLLATDDGLPPVTRDVALHHQERLDGSGYPFGSRGEDISQAARMAAICDTYETLTSASGGRKGMRAAHAIAAMYAMDQALDCALLFKFMRSIGVFPARMVVRLRSNRLGLVLPSQGDDRRTMARAFYSTIETRFIDYADVALSDSLADDQAVSVEIPTRWFAGNWETMAAAITAGKPIGTSKAGTVLADEPAQ